MKITSRKRAIEELGKLGGDCWDDCSLLDINIRATEYTFERPPKKLEPLSDEEAVRIFNAIDGSVYASLKAVIQAHDARRADIAAQETEEDLINTLRLLPGGSVSEFWGSVIAKVRDRDAAKKQLPVFEAQCKLYPEDRIDVRARSGGEFEVRLSDADMNRDASAVLSPEKSKELAAILDPKKSPWRKQSEEPAPLDMVFYREPAGHVGCCDGGVLDPDDIWMHIPK